MNTFFLNAEIQLVFAESAQGNVKSGQPVFFLSAPNKIKLFEEPTWFIHRNFVTFRNTPSRHTWAAVSYDLLGWLQWLQQYGVDWTEATEAHRQQLSDDYSRSISPSGEHYSPGTINRRVTNVRRFYEFARHEGWYLGNIGIDVKSVLIPHRPIDVDPLAHIRSGSGRERQMDRLLVKCGRKDVIRPLMLKDLKKLLEHLAQDSSRLRDRLIADLGWVVGLRVGEVCRLTTLQFLQVIVEPGEEMKEFPITIWHSKGQVTRIAPFPGWLIQSIQSYISGERVLSNKSRKVSKPATALFLGHPQSRGAGVPIKKNTIQKMMYDAAMAVGITEKKSVIDPVTGNTLIKSVPAHSFHDLRHNAAVLRYHIEKNLGQTEPWKAVQVRLGHKSLKTTIDTYLSHVEIFGEKQGLPDIRRLLGMK